MLILFCCLWNSSFHSFFFNWHASIFNSSSILDFRPIKTLLSPASTRVKISIEFTFYCQFYCVSNRNSKPDLYWINSNPTKRTIQRAWIKCSIFHCISKHYLQCTPIYTLLTSFFYDYYYLNLSNNRLTHSHKKMSCELFYQTRTRFCWFFTNSHKCKLDTIDLQHLFLNVFRVVSVNYQNIFSSYSLHTKSSFCGKLCNHNNNPMVSVCESISTQFQV